MTTVSNHLRDTLDGRWIDVRRQARELLSRPEFAPHYTPDTVDARAKATEQLRLLAKANWAESGFLKEHGGTGDAGAAVTLIESLAESDLSLMVKAGVQWGLFGGAIEALGTERHHEKFIRPLIDLEILGCYGMSESGHGSDVQSLETTATYIPETREFEINTPTPSARKDYIGGAAESAQYCTVFAQLVTGGPGEEPTGRGVHCFVVKIRDENFGTPLPGVTIEDIGYKGGLPGVDNGRLHFDRVRIPRENMLNKIADVAEDGTYSSPIENPNRRFFTMLGTLIRGRITVGGSAASAGKVALTIAAKYALHRKQFKEPGSDTEVVIMDYLSHQRRLLPLIAKSYALQFAQNELVSAMHDLQSSGEDPDPTEQRELEGRAAGLKAANTWHATRAIQESREACGGAGYLAENRLIALKADSDVFTTFEGDNLVLTQLVAKELLTSYAHEVRSFDAADWVKFAATTVGDAVMKRTAAAPIIQTLVDGKEITDAEGSLYNRGTQISMFEDRERYLITSAARRLDAQRKKMSQFEAFNWVQDHVLHAAKAHVDRVVLEAFVAGIDNCDDPETKELLGLVCDLYALSTIDEDKAWFIEHRLISTERSKAVTRGINDRCRLLRPHVKTLIDGFGIPDQLTDAAMLGPEY